MSKILKVSEGDYRIKVPTGNSITLDTGVLTGSVIITGDLDIKGQTTTIESTNATIKDNIIVLNNGEPHTNGSGITLGTSGIQIDRGTDSAVVLTAKMLFNESVSHFNPITNTVENGTYVLTTSRDSTNTLASLQISSVELSAISSNGTNTNGIAFNLRSTNTTLTVVNSTYNTVSYENRLIDSSLTTKLYVNTYVVSGNLKPFPSFTPFSGSMADVDTIYKKTAGNVIKSMVETTVDSEIIFKINTAQRAIITTTGLSVDTLNLFGNTIKNTGANPLVLTSDVNLVELNSVLALDNQSVVPTVISGKTQIYSTALEGPGRTGIYFTNNNVYGSSAFNNDELVSRNRALLFSMLF
jgi:hypothetical protein